MKPTILVVDDDPEFCRMMTAMLNPLGAAAISAESGRDAIRAVTEESPHLILLDIMMPEMDGLETCRRLRQITDVPIIMLTALSGPQHIVRGLDAGADDYVTKPFRQEILLARCRAALRRSPRYRSGEAPTSYSDEFLRIDVMERTLEVNGEALKMSPLEFQILALLVSNPGSLFTYNQILWQVWGMHDTNQVSYVHNYVSRLRRKIERDPDNPCYLITEPTIGYRFEPCTRTS